MGGVERVGGDGAEGCGCDGEESRVAAEGDAADGVVADVALVVGVDDVRGGPAEGGEGFEEGGPVGGGVDVEERGRDVGGVVDGPAEGDGSLLGGEDGGDDGGDDVAVPGGGDVEDDVFAVADVDDFFLMEECLPVAVGGLVVTAGGGGADVLDGDVLDVRAEVGEAPGDVIVVADDDEGDAGERDAGYVEVGAVGVGGLEVGLVPDAGDAVGEVHVVGEERLAGGGVGAGDGPVVAAGDAVAAGDGAEGLLEGDEIRFGCAGSGGGG